MKSLQIVFLSAILLRAFTAPAQETNNAATAQSVSAPRVVDLKSADGTFLKASYFAATAGS
jgi:hypothetical protein